MTSSDKKLMLLGAGPASVCAIIMIAVFISGIEFNKWIAALATFAVFCAFAFPALANILRLRRSR